jgi:hypothetical protein
MSYHPVIVSELTQLRSLDLHRTALDAVHTTRSRFHVSPADDNAPIAPERDARRSASKDDLILGLDDTPGSIAIGNDSGGCLLD